MGKIIRQIHRRQPLTVVIVSAVNIKDNKIEIDLKRTSKPYRALVDTGATASVISNKIIEALKLEPIGKAKVNTASHGNQDAYVYNIVLGIALDEQQVFVPNRGVEIAANWLPIPVQVTNSESISEQNFDVLLGMDIISQGHLSVSEGLFIFSI